MGAQVAGVGVGIKAGKNVRVGAEASLFPVEVSVSSKGAKAEVNAFKIGATLKVGPYKAGGDAKAGTYSAQVEPNGNASFNRDETLATSGSASSGTMRETRGMGITSDNQIEGSMKVGELSVTLGAEIDQAKAMISNLVDAASGYVRNLFTDLSNNSYNTDSRNRSQGEYMQQEKMR